MLKFSSTLSSMLTLALLLASGSLQAQLDGTAISANTPPPSAAY